MLVAVDNERCTGAMQCRYLVSDMLAVACRRYLFIALPLTLHKKSWQTGFCEYACQSTDFRIAKLRVAGCARTHQPKGLAPLVGLGWEGCC